MKRSIKYIIKLVAISLLIFLCKEGVTQVTLDQYFNHGKEALEDRYFNAAMEYLWQAHQLDPERTDIMYNYGVAAFHQKAFIQSEWAFHNLLDSLGNTEYADATFFLAETKYILGKYQEAIDWYNIYLSEYEDEDPSKVERAEFSLKSVNWALEQSEINERVNVLRLPELINSSFSEHAAIQFEGDLYYSALKYPKSEDVLDPSRLISKIIRSDAFEQTLEMETDGFFNDDRYLTSSMTINADGNLIMYTICDYLDKSAFIQCNIYCREISENGWGEEQKLSDKINLQGHTNTHPCFGPDQNGNNTLYFVSDRPGGKGGLDIWYSTFDDDLIFSEATNVAEINTEGNEISPYYDPSSHNLFFSTNGIMGFGGFDVYKYFMKGKANEKVQNLGMPVNSSFDDIYYSYYGKEGYLSSNRPGSSILDEKFEACCFDIYKVGYLQLNLKLLTFDAYNNNPLFNTNISLRYEWDGQERIITKNHPAVNEYDFQLDWTNQYTVEVSKKGYVPKEIKIEADSTFVTKKVYLERKPVDLFVHTFDADTRLPLDGSNLEIYQIIESNDELIFSEGSEDRHGFSYQLLPGLSYKLINSKPGYYPEEMEISVPMQNDGSISEDIYLKKNTNTLIVNTYRKNPIIPLSGVEIILKNLTDPNKEDIIVQSDTNFVTAEIEKNHTYKMYGFRSGYEPDSLEFISEADPNGIVFKELYLDRIQEFEVLDQIIPLKLYFDNDQPDSRSLATNTRKNYTLSYFLYTRKIAEFRDLYSSRFGASGKETAIQDVNNFFASDLQNGYDEFLKLINALQSILRKGKTIKLYIRGFASPLSDSNYNLNLGSRRVQSIKNEILEYNNGLLRRYLKSGQLVIVERSFGESLSPEDVSDDPNNPSLSIFSPLASRERRVEIDEITQVFNRP